jgi:hypothetical protein
VIFQEPIMCRTPLRACHAAAALLLGAVACPAFAEEGSPCSTTAALLSEACVRATEAAWLVGQANCVNERGPDARASCRDAARQARHDAEKLCQAQDAARQAACTLLGEQRYDPVFKPARFDRDPGHPSHPNPYFPVGVGYRWEFRGGGERNAVEVLDATKDVEGVSCAVVRDLVYEDGEVTEATDDWLATARDGAVWYCGEEVKEYAYFRGDRPRRRELVSTSGSFKHGRGGAKAGILMLATPSAGAAYREEFSLANAEDMAVVLSTHYRYGDNAELDRHVPQELAELLCADGDCVVTQNTSLTQPSDLERKYYARGIGVFAETTRGGGVSQLVACNVDPRCEHLPPPR